MQLSSSSAGGTSSEKRGDSKKNIGNSFHQNCEWRSGSVNGSRGKRKERGNTTRSGLSMLRSSERPRRRRPPGGSTSSVVEPAIGHSSRMRNRGLAAASAGTTLQSSVCAPATDAKRSSPVGRFSPTATVAKTKDTASVTLSMAASPIPGRRGDTARGPSQTTALLAVSPCATPVVAGMAAATPQVNPCERVGRTGWGS